jgi:hypothetical protein
MLWVFSSGCGIFHNVLLHATPARIGWNSALSAMIHHKPGNHPFRLYGIDKDGADLKPSLTWSGQE